jgi:hypothetical protein
MHNVIISISIIEDWKHYQYKKYKQLSYIPNVNHISEMQDLIATEIQQCGYIRIWTLQDLRLVAPKTADGNS